MSMRFRRALPRFLAVSASSLFSSCLMFPHPRIWPIVGMVHLCCFSGQCCLTRFQIVFLFGCVHSNRMCSRDSIGSEQWAHIALCS